MSIYPKKYSKEEFLKYLKRNKVSTEIISKFVELPESVMRTGTTFRLDVNTTWYNKDDTHYNFELNYYSEDVVEYLFNLKVFTNVEVSVNYLLCELINNGYINNKKNCK